MFFEKKKKNIVQFCFKYKKSIMREYARHLQDPKKHPLISQTLLYSSKKAFSKSKLLKAFDSY